ncbi:MAG: GNAT family N-acetyltransferase [Deltaproteobacteria bacterium]|nr:GNAT family N-acetyltransferase [Deltaproteobacteria bacterium]
MNYILYRLQRIIKTKTDAEAHLSNDFKRFKSVRLGLSSFIIFWDTTDGLDIVYYFTAANKRQRGLATYLFKKMLRKFAGKRLFMDISPTNHASLNLARKLGFRLIGIRPNYYNHKTPAYLFSYP